MAAALAAVCAACLKTSPGKDGGLAAWRAMAAAQAARRTACVKPSPRKDRGLAGAHDPWGDVVRAGMSATPWGHGGGRAAACREEPWAAGSPQPRDPGSGRGPPRAPRGAGAVHRLPPQHSGGSVGLFGCGTGEGRAGEPGAQLQPFISPSRAIRQMTEGERQPVQALRPRLLPLGDLSPGFIQQTC